MKARCGLSAGKCASNPAALSNSDLPHAARSSRIVSASGVRTQIALDLFNALNSNTVETYNQSTSVSATGVLGAYLPPTGILPARFAKISGQLDF